MKGKLHYWRDKTKTKLETSINQLLPSSNSRFNYILIMYNNVIQSSLMREADRLWRRLRGLKLRS